MTIDNLVQHTWLTTAGTFTLPGLSLNLSTHGGSCPFDGRGTWRPVTAGLLAGLAAFPSILGRPAADPGGPGEAAHPADRACWPAARSSSSLSGLTLTVTEAGRTLVTGAVSASFSGNVVLYAAKLSGKVLGRTLTLTPGNAESTLLQLLDTPTPLVPVTMTGVTADQPVVLGNSGTISGLTVRTS